MNEFSDLLKMNWNLLLIQGGVSSGKSQLGLMVANKMIENNLKKESFMISQLLNSKKMAILTERLAVAYNDPLFLKIKNKAHLVEYITSINIFEKIQYLYEYQGVNYIFLDYVNLLTYQQSNFERMIDFMNLNNMKGVFIENTAKLKHHDFNLSKNSDIILRSSFSKGEDQVIEVDVLKKFNFYVYKPQCFFLKTKDF